MRYQLKISIIIPAYNEEKSIGKTLEKLVSLYPEQEIIVIDDGSTDKTAETVSSFKSVKLYKHPVNRGYGASLKTGILNAGRELICIMDADGTYDPEDIGKLVEFVNDYEMVVGVRKSNVPIARRPAKFLLTKVSQYLSGQKIEDLNCGLRIFKKKGIKRFFNILPNGFSFTTTSTLSYLTNNLPIKYVPINYYKRESKSTINPVKDFFNFNILIIKTITYFNPLKIFFPVGGILFAAGVLKIILDLLNFNITQSAIILIVVGIQILFVGLLADVVVKTRNW